MGMVAKRQAGEVGEGRTVHAAPDIDIHLKHIHSGEL